MLMLSILASLAVAQVPPVPPGRLVDVGGHALHIHCLGSGAPTVVFDAGVGGGARDFADVQRRLAESTTVCTYDRAGMFWSQAGPEPRTTGRIVSELHQLLHAAGVSGPLVLAGHSFGGYTVRLYQARYPDEVAALVLIDAAHPEQNRRLVGVAEAIAAAAGSAPPGPASEMRALEISTSEVPRTRLPDDLPFVVLTARNSFDAFHGTGLPIAENARIWATLQDELAALSSRTTRLFSDGDHRLHQSDPDAVVDAVSRAVAEARRAGRDRPTVLGRTGSTLPALSTPLVDGLLLELEEAYRTMDLGLWRELFAPEFEQLDVPRRVHIRGRSDWMDWTSRLNDWHRSMERKHGGRALAGDVLVVEIEWSGVLRAEAIGAPEDRAYRYSGLALIELDGRRIARQVIFGDAPTLMEQIEPRATSSTQRPSFQDQLLDRLVGNWVMEGTVAGDSATHDVVVEWVLGHQYLQIREVAREKDEQGAPAYAAIVYIGWDATRSEYTCLWLDVTGSGGLTGDAIGRAQRAGDSIPFVFNAGDYLIRNTFAYDRSSDTWTWNIDNDRDGERSPFARLTLRRAK